MANPKRVAKRTIEAISRVSTPTITTILMAEYGLNNVAIRDVWPCSREHCRFAGPAYTFRYLPLREDLQPQQHLDHRLNVVTPAVESLPERCVVVLDANHRNDVGMLGGNLVMRMRRLGVAGIVTDGGMRDIPEIASIDLPVFVTATAAPPSFTKLMCVSVQEPISCGGVTVFPNDIIVGDEEGVVCVPAHLTKPVAELGIAKDHIEGYIHQRIQRGESIVGLYPPNQKVQKEYAQWVEAGEPSLD